MHTTTIVYRFRDKDGKLARELEKGGRVEDHVATAESVTVIHGNVLLDEGANFIWRAVRGDSGLAYFNGANTYIGVGDGTAPESPGQTGLQGSNKYYKKVDSGYPVVSGRSIVFRATFGPDEANFAWNEWTVSNGPGDDAVNLNRKTASMGVKAPGSTWVLQVSISL